MPDPSCAGLATAADSWTMISAQRVAAACTLFGAGLIVMAVLAAPAVAAGRSVAVTYDLFSPTTITVRVGDTITWTNKDAFSDHNVTSSSFKSGTLSPGDTYKHTFAKAGTFGYRCTIHDTKAKVVVTGPPTPQPTRRPTPTPPHAPPRPTPSPSPSPSPTASASAESATTSATQTSTSATASSAIALSSTSTASSPADQAAPVADTGSPTIVVLTLVLALAVAGAVALGAITARRR
jgi:plastocyanin